MTQAVARPWFQPDGPRFEKPPTVRELLGMPPPRDRPDDAPPRVSAAQRRARFGDFLTADFWKLSEREQLHALAEAIVRSSRYPTIREIMVGARLEIRLRCPDARPTVAMLIEATRLAAQSQEVTRRRQA